MAEGVGSFLQATVAADGLSARIDVLRRAGDGWRVTEVKSSTKPKEAHYVDLAFQWHVATAAGIEVREASVVLIDTTYVREGEVDPSRLLQEVDVTDSVVGWLDKVRAELALPYDSEARPDILPDKHCEVPYDCPFLEHCTAQLPDDDLYFAPGMRDKERTEFREAGKHRMVDLTDEDNVGDVVARARETFRTGRPYVDARLRDTLSAVAYPILFVDFEAVEPPIPRYEGTRPYQRLPFQWSGHVVREVGGDSTHEEFLWDEDSDPSAAFVQTLTSLVEGAATVGVYSQFERQTVNMLAKQGVPGAQALADQIVAKEFDLLKAVRTNVYDRAFRGSFSIKSVLPALVPGVDYKGLEVRDGDMAVAAYLETLNMPHGPERDAKRRALLAYCEQDTWAMVLILDRLYEMAGLGGGIRA